MAPRPPTPSRHKARELALQVLYAVDHSEAARNRSERDVAGADAGAEAGADVGADVRAEEQAATPRGRGAGTGAATRPSAPRRRLPQAHHRKAEPIWAPTQPASAEETFEAVAEHFEMAPGARDFARELALSTHAREGEVDELVSAHARNWRVDRMAVVDRNILRMATYELCFTDTPTAVVLDEAINLARRFGDDPSPSFVNGILDAVARGVRPSRA